MINGRFIHAIEDFHLANVYAPCDFGVKKLLWDSISIQLQLLVGEKVFVW